MTRDEVLERLDAAGADRGPIEYEMVHVSLLRAAAEIIRAGGWRPIAEAPEDAGYFGKRTGRVWIRCYLHMKELAVQLGYTHYLPEPEPPAREESKSKNGEENDRQNQDNKCIG